MQFLARPLKPFASLKIFALFIILSKIINISLVAGLKIQPKNWPALGAATTLDRAGNIFNSN